LASIHSTVFTTVGTPFAVLNIASESKSAAMAAVVMITYSTGLPSSDGTPAGTNGPFCALTRMGA